MINPSSPHFFHPLTQRWFAANFSGPTVIQLQGWESILRGEHTLIAAPTGSGKTLAAFLVFIDQLLRSVLAGTLEDGVQVLYVSPLKALSNDIHRNLEAPLAGIMALADETQLGLRTIRAMVRTGDTPAGERAKMLRKPPQILVTTPESLFLILTSKRSSEMLRTVKAVIVDEIHALARDKRGSHLTLSLERLDALCTVPVQRIGLSATQKPIDVIAAYLVGAKHLDENGKARCAITDAGHAREMELNLRVPAEPLDTVCSHKSWEDIYNQLVHAIEQHRSTVIFVNTRRMAERIAYRLTERMGEDKVASHHGSLSRERRLNAEEALKGGRLKVIVATASLELGIDIGYIDLVVQIGSPRNIAAFLQRVGRSGHAVGRTPRGDLVALTRDELVEAIALIRSVRAGILDQVKIPVGPLDILCQQIVATVSAGEWDEDALFAMVKGAYPYRDLTRDSFEKTLQMMAEGFADGRRSRAFAIWDRINHKVRARKGARLAALTSGGAIPELGEYRVILEGDETFIGSVNEDFALESMAGDIFLLGNSSWQIAQVVSGKVIVRDAHGASPTIPFWEGEAPGRSFELSRAVSQTRQTVADILQGDVAGWDLDSYASEDPLPAPYVPVCRELEKIGIGPWPALQAAHYIAVEKAALGLVPTMEHVVFERFFDEAGGMQLVIHSCYGMAINRAWGLALRKRFCRSFNFELQASADDNGIVLSLGPQHSFPIPSLFAMLNAGNVEAILIQALLDVPMFQIRWRWNATRALAVLRSNGGKKVPPPLQRFRADDLLSAAFPMATACLENVVGDIPIPDHPLVAQTVTDCMTEAMDLVGLKDLLSRYSAGEIQFHGMDSREPSPFCYQLLNSNPYTFLDDAPLQERRARAVQTRRSLPLDAMTNLGALSPEAVSRVCAEAEPFIRDADECHTALMDWVACPEARLASMAAALQDLRNTGRITYLPFPSGNVYFAVERWPEVRALWPAVAPVDTVHLPPEIDSVKTPEDAGIVLMTGWMACLGPTTVAELCALLPLSDGFFQGALARLEAQGLVMRGRFRDDAQGEEFCDRRLLARIHRLTLDGLRSQIKPVTPADFIRFLCRRHGLFHRNKGRNALKAVIHQLQGYELNAGLWEMEVLPIRVDPYDATALDQLTYQGKIYWGRARRGQGLGVVGFTKATSIALFEREDLKALLPKVKEGDEAPKLSPHADQVFAQLKSVGASFPHDLVEGIPMLPSKVDDALGELAYFGLVSCDGFYGLRRLLDKERSAEGLQSRWYLFPPSVGPAQDGVRIETWIRLLMERYGVLFRDLLAREPLAPRWGEMLPTLRLMELQGRLRGGRFVADVFGEQFARDEDVASLRLREPGDDGYVVLSAADPINLCGVITKDRRIPAQGTNRVLLRGGYLVGYHIADESMILVDAEPEEHETWLRALRYVGSVRARLLP